MRNLIKYILMLIVGLAQAEALAAAGGMISQVNGTAGNVTTGLTRYLCPIASGSSGWFTVESQGSCIMPSAGTFSNFYVSLSGASGTGSRQFTLFVNGADPGSSLDATITNGTAANDTTHTVTVAAGDTISIRQITSGTLNSTKVYWGYQFQAAVNTKEQPILYFSASGLQAGFNGVSFSPIQGDNLSSDETENGQTMPTGGSLSKLRVSLSSSPSTNEIITIRKRGTGNTALTCTVSSGSTTCTDITHTLTVAAGEVYDIQWDGTNDNNGPIVKASMIFNPTTDGEMIALSNSTGARSQNASYFLSAEGGNQSAAENAVQELFLPGTAKNFYAQTESNIGGAGQTDTYVLNAGGVAKAVTCQIASGASSCNDTTHTYSIAQSDLLSLKMTLSATTGSVTSYSGMVIAMNTATPTPSSSGAKLFGLTGVGN